MEELRAENQKLADSLSETLRSSRAPEETEISQSGLIDQLKRNVAQQGGMIQQLLDENGAKSKKLAEYEEIG